MYRNSLIRYLVGCIAMFVVVVVVVVRRVAFDLMSNQRTVLLRASLFSVLYDVIQYYGR